MSNGQYSGSPQPWWSDPNGRPPVGQPVKKAQGAVRKSRRQYPVAQPYAPPPTPPARPHRAAGRTGSSAPAAEGHDNSLRTIVVVAGIVIACMAGGWYFFRGPGAAVIKNMMPGRRHHDSSEEVAAVVDNSRPDRQAEQTAATSPSKEPARPPAPPEKPKVEATPQPPPPEKPKPEPPPVKPPPEEPKVAGIVFEKHVLPIIEGKCKNCHNDEKKRGGLDLTTLAALLKGGESGPAVVAGSLEKSLMWKTVSANEMPPTPNKLNPMERKILQEWIETGARGGAVSAQAAKP